MLVRLTCCTRPIALPVLFRLWAGRGTTTPVELAVQLVGLVAAAWPDRRVDVVADGAFSSPALRALPGRVSWTLRLRRNARLDALASPRTGRRGRPRLRGDRLGTPADLAVRAAFRDVEVLRYGQRCRVGVATVTCLWWEPLHTRTCGVVLLRKRHPCGYDRSAPT